MKISACLNPRYIINPYTKQGMLVPCGVCEACTLARGASWRQRLIEESHFWKYAVFFTLTYSDEWLPQANRVGSFLVHSIDLTTNNSNKNVPFVDSFFARDCFNRFGFIPVLSRNDARCFVKVLRRKIFDSVGHTDFSYYLIGEYGATSFRPHLHGLIFYNDTVLNSDASKPCSLSYLINISWSDLVRDFRSKYPQQLGITDIQGVDLRTNGSFSYVSQYLNCTSYLPQILQQKEFAQFRISSHKRPIGTDCNVYQALRENFFTGTPYRVVRDSERFQDCAQLLTRNYYDSLFPKHRGFNTVDLWTLVSVYEFVCQCSSKAFVKNFETLYVDNFRLSYGDLFDFDSDSDIMSDRLIRLYYSFKLVKKVCNIYHVTPQFYFDRYRLFWSRYDLFKLGQFYELQDELGRDIRFDKRFFQCLYVYDDQSSVRSPYGDFVHSYYSNPQNCPQFVHDMFQAKKILLDSTKTKKRNSFLSKKDYISLQKQYLNL